MHLKEPNVNVKVLPHVITPTVRCKIVGNEIFKYPISASEKYHNEFPTPKYVGIDTLIIIME